MTCRGPVPIIISEHLAGRTKSGRGPDPARGPRLARGCSKSLICVKNKIGPSTEPCGTPLKIDFQVETYQRDVRRSKRVALVKCLPKTFQVCFVAKQTLDIRPSK